MYSFHLITFIRCSRWRTKPVQPCALYCATFPQLEQHNRADRLVVEARLRELTSQHQYVIPRAWELCLSRHARDKALSATKGHWRLSSFDADMLYLWSRICRRLETTRCLWGSEVVCSIWRESVSKKVAMWDDILTVGLSFCRCTSST